MAGAEDNKIQRRKTMKRLVVGLLAGALLFGSAGAVLAGNTPGMSGSGTVMGSQMHGSGNGGMMGGSGPGGMMGDTGPGGMMGSGGSGGMMSGCDPGAMMGSQTQATPQGKPINLVQAQQQVQRYIKQSGKPNLTIDEVMEFQNNFYAIVKDNSTGHGAFEVLVNKVTGTVFPEYGPAMMWNTSYGVMTHMMGYQQPSGPMTVSATQATKIARQWVNQHQPGATIEAPDQFPGYYTAHILKNGKVTGMLSINGYTSQVWNHTWHGNFIQMTTTHS
jgi:hypothetical protein